MKELAAHPWTSSFFPPRLCFLLFYRDTSVPFLTPPQESKRMWEFADCPRAGFLSLRTIDIWGWIIPCLGSCPVHGRMFNSIPGLYPTRCYTHIHTQIWQPNISHSLSNVPCEADPPQLRMTSPEKAACRRGAEGAPACALNILLRIAAPGGSENSDLVSRASSFVCRACEVTLALLPKPRPFMSRWEGQEPPGT